MLGGIDRHRIMPHFGEAIGFGIGHPIAMLVLDEKRNPARPREIVVHRFSPSFPRQLIHLRARFARGKSYLEDIRYLIPPPAAGDSGMKLHPALRAGG